MIKRLSKHGVFARTLALASFSLFYSGCSGAEKPAVPASTPAPVALKKSIEAEMTSVVSEKMKELSVPGTIVGVWRTGYEPWVKAYGLADIATNRPMNTDDTVRIGSITKTFTGTVILQLVDEGKIGIDDPVEKYMPGVPNGKNITIRQMGEMTSGLYNYSEDPGFEKTLLANPTKVWTLDELLKIAYKHPPYFAPGKGFHYSNTNTILLGMIIEKLTGKTLQDEISRRILVPLGMTHTSLALDTKMPEPHAHGYYYPDNVKPPTPPTDVTNWSPSWTWSAGTLISTLEDVHKYAKPLATGKLVSEKSHAERLKWYDQPLGKPDEKYKDLPRAYGFTVFTIGGFIGHNGGLPGYQSFMAHHPEMDATVVVLCNIQETPPGVSPADEFGRLLILALKKQ